MDPVTALALAGVAAGVAAAWFAVPAFRSEQARRRILAFSAERKDLIENRVRYTTESCDLYSSQDLVPGTRALTATRWVLPSPLPLENVKVEFEPVKQARDVTGLSPNARGVLPSGLRTGSYTDLLSTDPELRPRLWWDGPSFDLVAFEAKDGAAVVRCGLAQYFEMVDLCESIAHEFVRERRRKSRPVDPRKLRLRREVGDPFDPSRRVFLPAVPTLPLFEDEDGHATFLMHVRDASAVVSQGGFRHVLGGQFQPSSEHVMTPGADADLWLTVCRELAEELLGFEDASGHASGRLAFDEPPLSDLQALRDVGDLRIWMIGLTLDPLSLWPDLLTVAVFREAPFRERFPVLVTSNTEGTIVGSRLRAGRLVGFDFSEEVIEEVCCDPTTAPAAGACLRLAWEHREKLLS